MRYFLIPTLAIAAATFVSATPMPQGGAFASQNIPTAINENKGFATLSKNSPCDPTAQPNACIDNAFSQCVGNSFVVGAACSPGTQCFSLPLVNKVGTSTTCTTPADAAARMGFNSVPELDAAIGNPNPSPNSATLVSKTPAAKNSTAAATSAAATSAAATTTPVSAAATPTPAAGSIASQNIPLAIAQNQKFQGLSAGSPCDAATQPNACANGDFAQCVGGKLVTTPCGAGLQCFALPLVNKPGTSVSCTTPDDAARRMNTSVGNL